MMLRSVPVDTVVIVIVIVAAAGTCFGIIYMTRKMFVHFSLIYFFSYVFSRVSAIVGFIRRH